MGDLIKFDHLARVLQDYGTYVEERYKQALINDGHKASGKLISTMSHIMTIGETSIQVDLQLEDYWKYVEEGRKKGKFPPPNKILDWVRVKPVLPRPMNNGKLPTQEQLAFLIGRKIAQEGIPYGGELKDTLDQSILEWEQRINDAIDLDIQEAVDNKILVFLYN